jgi:serine/threonine protein kinase
MSEGPARPLLGPPEIQDHEIEAISELGTGSFGTVCRGRCRAKDVAVKVLHRQLLDESSLQSFRKEVEIVRLVTHPLSLHSLTLSPSIHSKIFHPNIVLFMGACTVPGKMMIVTELMPKGDLETILKDRSISLGLLTRMKMAKDAALGMTWCVYTLS